MRFSRRFVKIAAVFFGLLYLQGLIMPPLAHALTSGPAAPEYSSFEPVDATDMVNLQSGDFTYTLPILEVPGPEGGYPMALSYHSGVSMEHEASWVGLGWTLNAGAINRQVQGYPDDWNGRVISTHAWDRGKTYTWEQLSINVSFGAWSVGLSVNWDSNGSVGFSVNASYMGVTLSIGTDGIGVSFGIGGAIGLGNSPFSLGLGGGIGLNMSWEGQTAVGVGAGVGIGLGFSGKGKSESGGEGQQADNSPAPKKSFKDKVRGTGLLTSKESRASAKASGFGGSAQSSIISVGISFSSVGTQTSFSVAGMDDDPLSRAKLGQYTVEKTSSGFDLGFIGYKKKTIKWWLDQRIDQRIFGPLYAANVTNSPWYSGSSEKMDVYSNPYNKASYESTGNNIYSHNNASFQNADNYQVNAQGIGATMTPQHHELLYLKRDYQELEYDNDNRPTRVGGDQLLNGGNPKQASDIQFGIRNALDSYYRLSPNTLTHANGENPSVSKTVFNADGYSTYNAETRKVVGSTWVEHFTNNNIHQINTGASPRRGFLEYHGVVPNSQGTPQEFKYLRTSEKDVDKDGIGGFVITTPDGKSYHYALPYQHESFRFNFKRGTSRSDFFTNSYDFNRYAYTWLLTGITGPDYVDRDNSGTISDGDWGYWVRFSYGKWVDSYLWRDPYTGMTASEGGSFESVNIGRKQLYYLNSVETRTHIAYFYKSQRSDGLSGTQPDLLEANNYELQVSIKADAAVPPLKLDKIAVFSKDNLPAIASVADSWVNANYIIRRPIVTPVESTEYDNTVIEGELPVEGEQPVVYTLPQNTVTYDYITSPTVMLHNSNIIHYNQNSNFEKSLRTIKFDYDYSLCPGTPNSKESPENPTKGKLSLKKVSVYGLGDQKISPPYTFTYYPDNPASASYNKEYLDEWGTHTGLYGSGKDFSADKDGLPKPGANNWHLKEIHTPNGALLRMHYESDSYRMEAALASNKRKINLTFNPSSQAYTLSTSPSRHVVEQHFTIGASYEVSVPYTIRRFQATSNGMAVIYPGDCSGGEGYFYNTELTYNGQLTLTGINAANELVFDLSPILNYQPTPDEAVCENLPTRFMASGSAFANVNSKTSWGGGNRISKIEMVNPVTNETFATEYDYTHPATGSTSGVTSFAPREGNRYVPYMNEIPAPSVMYEYVTIKQLGIDGRSVGKTVHQFEVMAAADNPDAFNVRMGNHFWVEDNNHEGSLSHESRQTRYSIPAPFYRRYDNKSALQYRTVVLHNNLTAIGRPISQKVYDANGLVVSETSYTYFQPNQAKTGVYQDAYAHYKVDELRSVPGWFDKHEWINGQRWTVYLNTFARIYRTLSSRVYYPNLVKSITTKTGGTQTVTENIDFDINTGEPRLTSFTDTYGNTYQSAAVSAHNVYADMGNKGWDATAKHMVAQPVASYLFKPDGTANPQYLKIAISSKYDDDTPYMDVTLVSALPERIGVGNWVYIVGSAGVVKRKLTYVSADRKTFGCFRADAVGAVREIQYPNLSVSGAVFQASADVWSPSWSYALTSSSGLVQDMAPTTNNWRSVQSFAWYSPLKADGSYDSFTPFNWATGAANNGWRRTSNVTRFDPFSKPVEEMDINGNYAASKMGYGNARVIASATGARYNEFFHTSFEDAGLNVSNVNEFGGHVTGGENRFATTTAVPAHTGSCVYRQPNASSKQLFYFPTTPGRSFRLNGWIHSTNAVAGTTVDIEALNSGGTVIQTVKVAPTTHLRLEAGAWRQVEAIFDAPANTAFIRIKANNTTASPAYWDDLRFAPLEASVTGYAYDTRTGLMSEGLNAENMATRYEYDAGGNLKRIWKETAKRGADPGGYKLVSEQVTNYYRKAE